MIQIIRTLTKKREDDHNGKHIFLEAKKHIQDKKFSYVSCVKKYYIEGITQKEAILLAEKLFCESLTHTYFLNTPVDKKNKGIEIAYKPGVMNPEVASIIKAAHDIGVHPIAVDTSNEYIFYSNIPTPISEQVLQTLRLFNPLIEHIVKDPVTTLLMKSAPGKTKTIPLLAMDKKQLEQLSKDTLFLNEEEMLTIQKFFQKLKRNPTDCELETIAQTWSEHCAHKTFKADLVVDGVKKTPLIKRIKTEALKHDQHIVSAFVDNSGVMDFYDGYAICGKAETHNSPSAIEPYGGASTGSGGVFRDVVGTGKGAKTIAAADIFCFAKPTLAKEKLPDGCLPPEYLLKRCITAVKDYGNRVGIPTNNGSFHFHDDFRAKPTVLVGAYGILPKKFAQKGRAKTGDSIIALGGKTGRDGVHGATFSSGEMTDKTISVNSTAVQIGNAIEEKRVFDAILEARDAGCIRAITDCGAGGFSSAIGEMGEETGVVVALDQAPVKYAGLAPWEIWISESQERMVLAVPQEKIPELLAICKKHNTQSALIGTFTNTKRLVVKYKKEIVCDIDMKFLHHGLPKREMIATKPQTILKKSNDTSKVPASKKDWEIITKKILSHPNICSKEPIIRLYDHTVQGTNIIPPFSGETMHGPNDASVIKPLFDKPYGMILSHGLNPVLNTIDPYYGSLWAGVEALANYAAVGGNIKDVSLINNYVWPFPDEESLWTLDASVDAVVALMKTFNIPVISGKDSLSSTYRGKDGKVIKIPPVLCMSAFGKIADISNTITASLKTSSSYLYRIGYQDEEALAGSIYAEIQNEKRNDIPKVDLLLFQKTATSLFKAIQKGIILSCHDISEGGLFTTIFEMCAGSKKGAQVSLATKTQRIDYQLFNETAGSFIIEVSNREKAEALFKDVPYQLIGKTTNEQTLTFSDKTKQLFSIPLQELQTAWENPMKQYFS